ncbi:helix-turn-helix domain-containing protein [Paenibacillus sp. TC-CSREp1]|uniref:helix-turn-helix domain-containing protein n=1 Tax=Paenibacillus sp. TC-CSREp1 TaxID=3410089 RepID=UPI003CEA9E4D
MRKIEFGINQQLKELTEHRTDDLSIACYKTTIAEHVQGYIPLHWHDELQFVAVIQGKILFYINEMQLEVTNGNGVFINSGILHMAEDLNEGEQGSYLCLNVAPQSLVPVELNMKYVQPYVTATNLPFLLIEGSSSWGKQVLQGIARVRKEMEEQSPYYELNVAATLLEIWKGLVMNGYSLEHNSADMIRNKRMKDMLMWIHQNYAEPLRLEDIAKVGQLSRAETCRNFKQILRTTPMQYVLDYRIRKSTELLCFSQHSITQIAYEVGFNSTSYFIDQFRKIMKRTPLQYRREMQKGKQPVEGGK